MSNNNPHGHLNQPTQNSSWNPLQLEHQMNPMLQTFVRGPSPFDSMDLSLQSSRAAHSPAHKNVAVGANGGATAGHQGMTQHDYVHKQQVTHQLTHLQLPPLPQQQPAAQPPPPPPPSHMHAANNYPILSSNAAQQQQNAAMQQQHAAANTAHQHGNVTAAAANAKYLNSNGSECDAMLPPTSNASTAAMSHYMRETEAARLTENYSKMTQLNRNNYENEAKSMQKPVELISKDCSYVPLLPANKVSAQHQQMSPKSKLSPLHSYHSHQQEHTAYNNPPLSGNAGKHNGPHTPPPLPPSPATSQQQQNAMKNHTSSLLGNNAQAMDYNQLHLHGTQANQQQQQQQQHSQAHYAHFQQQQHHSQQQQHMQQQHLPTQHHSPMQQQQQQSQLSNLDASNRFDAKFSEPFAERSPIASPVKAQNNSSSMSISPESAESPARFSSNEESLDSQSNSNSSSRRRRSRKPNKTMRMSPAETMSDVQQQTRQQLQQQEDSNKKSAKSSASSSPAAPTDIKSPISPRSLTSASPNASRSCSNDAKSLTTPANSAELSATALDSGNKSTYAATSVVMQSEISEERAQATIDKIAEMIAKSSNDVANNCSFNKTDATTNLSNSPKTKKQRQALKLRNAEQNASNNSNNSNSSNINNNNECLAANDNAVNADDMQQQDDSMCNLQTTLSPTTSTQLKRRSLSPQSHSRSSSSSASSSSSCSNSSLSSSASKMPKLQDAPTTELLLNSSNNSQPEPKEPVRQGVIQTLPPSKANELLAAVLDANCDKNETAAETPLDLNCKNVKEPEKTQLPSDCIEDAFDVEEKLEEMFAGIEDEPSTEEPELTQQLQTGETETDINLALELSEQNAVNAVVAVDTTSKSSEKLSVVEQQQQQKEAAKLPLQLKIDGPPTTKAAKKTTLPSPPLLPAKVTTESKIDKVPPTTPPETATAKDEVDSKPMEISNKVLKRKPPPRRMSMVKLPQRRVSPVAKRRKSSDDKLTLPAVDAVAPTQLLPAAEQQHGKECQVKKERMKMQSNAVCAEKPSIDKKPLQTIVRLDDEKPSTSAYATAALAARTAKEAKANAVKKSKANTSKSKTRTTAAAAAAATNKSNQTTPTKKNAKTAATAAATGSNSKKSSKCKTKLKSEKREPDTSDEEAQIRDVEQKHKSPYVLIKNDGSISIVNTISAEDVAEKNKKQPANALKTGNSVMRYAHKSDNKVRGLQTSTLSKNYDSDTTDISWICAFCKHGPHRNDLGDLFGPVVIGIECEEYKLAMNDATAMQLEQQFTERRQSMASNMSAAALHKNAASPKKKKKAVATATETPAATTLANNEQIFSGISRISDNSFEVWFHENCLIWAPYAHSVANLLKDLEMQIWLCAPKLCGICQKYGASLCCLQRNCGALAHFPCARNNSWSLNECEMQVYCQQHAKTTVSTVANTLALIHIGPPTTL